MREEWEEAAACFGADWEEGLSWFPTEDQGRGGATSFELQDRIAKVKTICISECPVNVQCVESALMLGASAGIWGGLHAGDAKWKRLRRRFNTNDEWVAFYLGLTGQSGLLERRTG